MQLKIKIYASQTVRGEILKARSKKLEARGKEKTVAVD